MYYSARNLYGRKVNFREILKTAVSNRKLIRAVAYVIRTEGGEEKSFWEALSRIGIEIKMKDLQIFPGGLKKGDWDVGLAVDAIKFSDYLDAIVLVTGDGDFVPLVEYIKSARPAQIEIIAFGRTTSGKLKEMADDFVDLDQQPEKYLIK
ncbi:MAG: hypothetical protein COV69_02835 [Parcubacteria group bacterium CG11_big_fil_rev_8_21_14_0_20_39_14]|nr:MAG: hypothetical protein COV69_02835 [Parcubacteria group bacterium CG11_big_fil_rev_8_21_14_0_20_39_14]PIS35385.1 MAG: hypothetical protein COT36_02670 [Parcubacteria group bacterium CG08_land_8_20_14_0_20_38_56]